jgi:Recombination endonuclease VII.
MANTTARGYGHRHQQLRRALLPYAYGQDCPHCGLTMTPGQALDLDHTDDRRGYRGMAHASCNRRAGALKGNAQRQAAPDPEAPCTSRSW